MAIDVLVAAEPSWLGTPVILTSVQSWRAEGVGGSVDRNFGDTVRLWGAVMLASADRPLPSRILDGQTVLRSPAPSQVIEAAAARVGRALPASYVEFLSVSDGAFADGCGIVTGDDGYGLLPAAGVRRLRAVAPDHVALWEETFGGVEPEAREARADWQDVRSFAGFGDAVIITRMTDAICDCLVPVPPAVDAGGEGFEVWQTFKEGATRFLTFGRWLDQKITSDWVARHDEMVRRLFPGVDEQLAVIARWSADPDYHWFAVRQVRRLAAAPAGDARVPDAFDRLWDGDDPYLRLAAAQADLVHRRARALERLAVLADSAPEAGGEPTVALAAAATVQACDHPALSAEFDPG